MSRLILVAPLCGNEASFSSSLDASRMGRTSRYWVNSLPPKVLEALGVLLFDGTLSGTGPGTAGDVRELLPLGDLVCGAALVAAAGTETKAGGLSGLRGAGQIPSVRRSAWYSSAGSSFQCLSLLTTRLR